jgi:transposase
MVLFQDSPLKKDDELQSRVRHLFEVEGLSLRQIAKSLGLSRKKVKKLFGQEAPLPKRERKKILGPYERLIGEWYQQYPHLRASQVFRRLQSLGFSGGYTAVKEYTQGFRKKKARAYHELEFLPGEEAQVDWVQHRLPFGVVFGFVYLLCWSRYLYLRFYLRSTLEFFLDGHIEAFQEIGGVAHRHRYDNLKSVVINRRPELALNAQFVDFARHYGFSIYPCTPGRANEKGRVERAIRDINDFIRENTFTDLKDLNQKSGFWRKERNDRIHRTTGQSPTYKLKEEKLKPLPQIPYKPYRVIPAQVDTTGFVRFETNRYSVPSQHAGGSCQIFAYPTHLEIVTGKNTHHHPRLFGRDQKTEYPGHRQRLLVLTPRFKHQRIYQIIRNMDKDLALFLERSPAHPEETAYALFKLLKKTSKQTLLSAIREALKAGIYKLDFLFDLLGGEKIHTVRPQDAQLLNITYKERDLDDYDELV